MRGFAAQRGATLISLMVGLVISMIAVLGMLALYRTAVQVTTESTRYARVTGDRAAAIVNAETILQNAGFGIDEAGLAHEMRLCDGTSLSGSDYQLNTCSPAAIDRQKPVIVWRFETLEPPLGTEPAASWCEGLAVDHGQLLYLRPQPCADIASLSTWDEEHVSILFDTSGLAGGVFAGIELEGESCSAFGMGGAGKVVAKLEAHHPITDNPNDYNPADPGTFRQFFSRTCLTNIGGG